MEHIYGLYDIWIDDGQKFFLFFSRIKHSIYNGLMVCIFIFRTNWV